MPTPTQISTAATHSQEKQAAAITRAAYAAVLAAEPHTTKVLDTEAGQALRERIRGVVRDTTRKIGDDLNLTLTPARLDQLSRRPTSTVTRAILNNTKQVNRSHDGATLRQVGADLIGQISSTLATQIRSESTLALAPEVEKQTGSPLHKKWVAVMDHRTRPLHRLLHRNAVPLSQPFWDGPQGTINYPGDPKAPLDQVCNCRCHMIFTPALSLPMVATGLPRVLVAADRVGRLVDAAWDLLHPRGRDGQFIETNGDVDIFGLSGIPPSIRGVVKEIRADPQHPDAPNILVEITEPGWNPNYNRILVRSNQIMQHAKPKAAITPSTNPPPVRPLVPGFNMPTAPKGLPVDPNGPHFEPLQKPASWDSMPASEKTQWVKTSMETDLSEFRGKRTDWNPTGFDPELALNLANTYRDLTNWDPETTKEIDAVVPASQTGDYDPRYLTKDAIGVAYSGAISENGPFPPEAPKIIGLGDKFFAPGAEEFWAAHRLDQAQGATREGDTKMLPWSISTATTDPTYTLVHEFAHQRQFRFKETALTNPDARWADLRFDDNFDLVPTPTDWDTTRTNRWEIQQDVQTAYGQTGGSVEAYAEAWASRIGGWSSPELNHALDDWEARMAIPGHMPGPFVPFQDQTDYQSATAEQRNSFWEQHGDLFNLPEMRDRYPEAAADYDAWFANHPGKEQGTLFDVTNPQALSSDTRQNLAELGPTLVSFPPQSDAEWTMYDLSKEITAGDNLAKIEQLANSAWINSPESAWPAERRQSFVTEFNRLLSDNGSAPWVPPNRDTLAPAAMMPAPEHSLPGVDETAGRRKIKAANKNQSKASVIKQAQGVVDDVASWLGATKGQTKASEPKDYVTQGEVVESDGVPYARFGKSGLVMVNPKTLGQMGDKEYGVSDYRIAAHEAMHGYASGEANTLPGFSHDYEEGASELLSLLYWRQRGQPMDERDAIKVRGKWLTDPDDILAASTVYQPQVVDLARRAASAVGGWEDRDAIFREIRRVMAGDHNTRLAFRDSTDPSFPLPPGVAWPDEQEDQINTGRAVSRYLLTGTAGGLAPSEVPA